MFEGIPFVRPLALWGAAVCLTAAGHATAQQPAGLVLGFGDDFCGQTTSPPGKFIAATGNDCASDGIREDGTLYAWGDPWAGQTIVPGGTFTAVDGGLFYFIALRTDGRLAGWGFSDTLAQVVPEGTFREISAGREHALGIRTDGTIACWGACWGTIPPGNDFVAVAAGMRFSLALRANGAIEPWGVNQLGQLNVPPGSYTAIAAGQYSGAGLRTDGSVVTWGATGITLAPPIADIRSGLALILGIRPNGQLVASPGFAPALPPGEFIAIGAGEFHGLAIRKPCYANCDDSTPTPALNINDFTCFLNRYAAANPAANCDGSTVPPVLNVNDFICFLAAFAVGCP